MINVMKIGLLNGLLLCISVARAELPADYRVQLLTENFPPFNMAVNDKNFARGDGIDGISAEIVREMFKRADIQYSLTLRFPWARVYGMTVEKPNHGLFSTARTPERESSFKWVGPLASSSWVLVASSDSLIKVNSVKEARKYKVGAGKGNAVTDYVVGQGISPELTLRDQQNAIKLAKGEIDLWATDDPPGRFMASQEGIRGLQVVLTMSKSELYLALNKETPDEVVQRLQKALDELRAEGFVDEMSNSYL